jgi:hypothetical protein
VHLAIGVGFFRKKELRKSFPEIVLMLGKFIT